jgi:hypothetical protein
LSCAAGAGNEFAGFNFIESGPYNDRYVGFATNSTSTAVNYPNGTGTSTMYNISKYADAPYNAATMTNDGDLAYVPICARVSAYNRTKALDQEGSLGARSQGYEDQDILAGNTLDQCFRLIGSTETPAAESSMAVLWFPGRVHLRSHEVSDIVAGSYRDVNDIGVWLTKSTSGAVQDIILEAECTYLVYGKFAGGTLEIEPDPTPWACAADAFSAPRVPRAYASSATPRQAVGRSASVFMTKAIKVAKEHLGPAAVQAAKVALGLIV